MDLGKIGQFIAVLRKEQHLTQAQLGEKLGVSDKTVSKWEKGICAPNISILNDLSATLKITTTELLNGKKIENISKQEISNATTEGIEYYKHETINKFRKRILLLLLGVIILIAMITIGIYFKNNYNNCSIYKLESNDPNYEIKGLLVFTPNKDILIIESVENVKDIEFSNKKLYAYEYALQINEIKIIREGNLSLYQNEKHDKLISFDEILKKINIYKIESTQNNNNNLKDQFAQQKLQLKIDYLNEHKELETKIIEINLNRIYTNDKMIYSLVNNKIRYIRY